MATNTYVALATQTLGSAVSSVTFSSIPQGYTDLVVVFNGSTTSGNLVKVQFNGDTTDSNYSSTLMWGNGSSAASSRYSVGWTFVIPDAGNAMQNVLVNVMNYSNSTTYKTYLARANQPGASVTAAVGMWRNSAAITSLTLAVSGNQFTTGSTFTIYGIAAAAPLTAKATGGTIYYGADGYVYHKFTSSGTFTPSSALSADVLVVGGGGGGGTSVGGGGGGGGLLGFTSQALTTTGYTVTVGAGGASVGSNTPGNDGTSSQFGALTAALGGGGGGSYGGSRAGNPGGSGGGGCGWTTASNSLGGAGTSGQGYAGGNGGGPYGAGGSGGGGGAGGVGPSWTSGTVGAEGGRGSADYSSWAQITGSGVAYNGSYYFAAGGPGVYGTGGTQASGGYGAVAFGGAVTANTGQGGCGDYGYAGSAGIVIVRYPG